MPPNGYSLKQIPEYKDVSIQIDGRRGVVDPNPDDIILDITTDEKGVAIRMDSVSNPEFWMTIHLSKWQLETWLKDITS